MTTSTTPTPPMAPSTPPDTAAPESAALESAAPEPVVPESAPPNFATPDMSSGFAPEPLPSAPLFVPPMTAGGTVLPSADPSTLPTSAWVGTMVPAAPRRRRILPTIVTVVAVIIGLALIGVIVFGPSNRGQIIFGTTKGDDLCSVGSQTNTVNSGDPIYFTAILKDRMAGDQTVTLSITEDGQAPVTLPQPPNGSEFDCLAGDPSILGTLDPGVYHFVLTHNSDIEASGDLTVK